MGSRTGYGEEKREFEGKPFLLIPPISMNLCNSVLDQYLNGVLSDIGEEGGKKIFLYTRITGLKKYRDCPKRQFIKKLFGNFFESFEKLREELREGNLEKTAASIQMQIPNEMGFGMITYPRPDSSNGEFAYYKPIGRNLLTQNEVTIWNKSLLAPPEIILNSDWKKCLEE